MNSNGNNDSDDKTEIYHANLLASLDAINTYNPPVHTCSTGWVFNGLISGPTSIAYLFYAVGRLHDRGRGGSSAEDEEFEFKGQGMYEWAADYIGLGGHVPVEVPGGVSGDRVATFMNGNGKEKVEDEGTVWETSMIGCDEGTTWLVIRGILEHDPGCVGEVLKIVNKLGDDGAVGKAEVTDTLTPQQINWCCGYLYLLRLLKHTFPDSKHIAAISKITQRVIDLLLLRCTDVQTGHVHTGNIAMMTNILTQIILSRTQDHVAGLDTTINRILTLQNPTTGSWGPNTAYIVNCLASITFYLPLPLQETIKDANEKARVCLFNLNVTDTNLPPTMQPHGLVTRAMAFTDLGDARFHEVVRCVSGDVLDRTRTGWKTMAGRKDEWVGLGTGEAGRAWLWWVAGGCVERRILGVNDV